MPETLEDFGLSGFIHTDDGAIVIGEPHVAATWFPANDHPRDKATFTFHITVPAGVEALSNGALIGQQTSGGWTTWNWNAVEPMATYLAIMAIGQFDVDAYSADGLAVLGRDRLGAAGGPGAGRRAAIRRPVPVLADQRARLQAASPGRSPFRRAARQLSFDVHRDTEPSWDFAFVEARTAGGDDWTTLPDANGHTSQDTGECPYNYLDFNPFLRALRDAVHRGPGRPG